MDVKETLGVDEWIAGPSRYIEIEMVYWGKETGFLGNVRWEHVAECDLPHRGSADEPCKEARDGQSGASTGDYGLDIGDMLASVKRYAPTHIQKQRKVGRPQSFCSLYEERKGSFVTLFAFETEVKVKNAPEQLRLLCDCMPSTTDIQEFDWNLLIAVVIVDEYLSQYLDWQLLDEAELGHSATVLSEPCHAQEPGWLKVDNLERVKDWPDLDAAVAPTIALERAMFIDLIMN
ncbi:15616_t:CDS:2 [Acaulospora colombiana]|uniref:15616_t:CDS:1 n=1 Tax=Acaulospora colombiana TaxID=27376 RepID=A0ACA9N517_9GLOM|nr:15616_t:CDS:2 [Acaulospora colombiana]